MVMLVLSVVLGLVPLLGIGLTFTSGSITTVDGIFTSLILLTLSGILFLNAYLEARVKLTQKKADAPLARRTS